MMWTYHIYHIITLIPWLTLSPTGSRPWSSAYFLIEIGPDVKDSISISFCNIPLDEALKKITSNRGIVFSKKDENSYQISRVVIFASSKNQPNTKTDDHTSPKLPAHESTGATSTAVKTGLQAKPTTSLTIINEKIGIRSEVISNELIVRFKKGLSKEDIQALNAKTEVIIKHTLKPLTDVDHY